jgi:dolichol kinase
MELVISLLKLSSPFSLRNDLHLARKLWHMMTGIIGLTIFFQNGVALEKMATALLVIAVLAFIMEFARLRNEQLNQIVMIVMKPFMRESEKTSVSGMPFYALGVALSLFFFPERIAILAVLFLIFADPIASLFGILYGRDKILPNKSLQGTVAAFAVCYLVTLIYGAIYTGSSMNLLVFSIIAGVIGAVSELCSQFVDDNLCIPVLSGFGLFILNIFVPLF